MAYEVEEAMRIIKAADLMAGKIMTAIDMLNAMHNGKKNVPLADLCEIYVVAKRFEETIDTARKEITKRILNPMKMEKIPERFDDEGITTFTTQSGFRVVSSQLMSVSIIPEKKEAAFKWLRDNDMGPLITETVNAQTLSAQARNLLETSGKEFPEDFFKSSTTPTLSVTAVKKTSPQVSKKAATKKSKK